MVNLSHPDHLTVIYIAGTFDTKACELNYMRDCLMAIGLKVRTVDLSTLNSDIVSLADVSAIEVAGYHPEGIKSIFTGDRGTAGKAMALAFIYYIQSRQDVAGLLSAGGSGGTALVTPAMQALPFGIPKMMVSTMASGNTRPYVGPSDICMMHSVTDIQGINHISQQVLANAAHAIGGMIKHTLIRKASTKPAIGLTMFGVTTPCVQAVTVLLQNDYDCLVFHANGTGGQAMEKLAGNQLFIGIIDVTTTEIADELMGGMLSAGPNRLDCLVHSNIPYVGSCGALDMVNFGAVDTVPKHYRHRLLYEHNAHITLMRTNVDENVLMGQFIAKKLNHMRGPVCFYLPQGGLSTLDTPGMPFWNPAANEALFASIEAYFQPASDRQLVRTPYHINDPAFAQLLVAIFKSLVN